MMHLLWLARWHLLLLAFLLSLAFCFACSPEKSARKALEQQGYHDILFIPGMPEGCSRDAYTSSKFTATNPAGERMEGAVCMGLSGPQVKVK